jgi:hypothetical protein
MCGKMVKGIPARLPRRSNRLPKLLAESPMPSSRPRTQGKMSESGLIANRDDDASEGAGVDTPSPPLRGPTGLHRTRFHKSKTKSEKDHLVSRGEQRRRHGDAEYAGAGSLASWASKIRPRRKLPSPLVHPVRETVARHTSKSAAAIFVSRSDSTADHPVAIRKDAGIKLTRRRINSPLGLATSLELAWGRDGHRGTGCKSKHGDCENSSLRGSDFHVRSLFCFSFRSQNRVFQAIQKIAIIHASSGLRERSNLRKKKEIAAACSPSCFNCQVYERGRARLAQC